MKLPQNACIIEKKCPKCQKIKSGENFYHYKTGKTSCWCKECKKVGGKCWRLANPEKQRLIRQRWRKNNLLKARKTVICSAAKRYKTLKGRLEKNISIVIQRTLRGNKNGRKWETLVGYTVEQLKKHLEKKFQSGMTWENYGIHGWHIDHIIPQSAFNFEKPEDEDFKRCWALNNLQPMWAKDNMKKQNKLLKHFQPKLVFK